MKENEGSVPALSCSSTYSKTVESDTSSLSMQLDYMWYVIQIVHTQYEITTAEHVSMKTKENNICSVGSWELFRMM